ncbi:AAA family ATPase [Humitalea sp. 24SJ18S-53]|uniref:nucleotide-binding protein n=1 Tax=Humitalea sp. 24SJ18S-53 TaxID=3422307 RepID=UPI003D668713
MIPLPIPAGRVIAIASGKGGVGKTWFAITLSQALARQGRRVVLVDGDLGLANVDVQLGLNPPHGLADVFVGRLALDAALVEAGGVAVLAGSSGSGALAAVDPAPMLAILRQAAIGHDDVVLDCGAGLDATPRRLSAAADVLLVLATDEPTSLTDAYAAMKLAWRDAPGLDVRLVVNRAVDVRGGERTHAALAAAARNFLRRDLPLAGIVRADTKVPDAIRHQTGLLVRHPGCAAAEDVVRIARAL